MWETILKNIFRKKQAVNVGFPPPHAAAEIGEVRTLIGSIFNRSVRIRQVDAGSCNACEWECVALVNPIYDVQRFGIDFVASPRHADIVLVTGPISQSMVLALKQTILATPEPRIVIGCGDCTKDGGIYRGSYAVTDGLATVVQVAGYIAGCPPSPLQIIQGISAILSDLSA